MKHKIQSYEYKKVLSEEYEIEIPEKPVYYFQTGIRRAYAIVPVWTKWNKEHYQKEEEIYSLNVITVDPSVLMVEITNFSISGLNEIMRNENHSLHRLMENVLETPHENKRTEEEFYADYNNTLRKIHEQLTGIES
jgi:hypothetical protein